MRVFTSEDGRSWSAVAMETQELAAPAGFGWQAVLFRAVAPDTAERIAYRQVGWLIEATQEELRATLAEADAVRARWGTP